ncbi:MAG: hypothetical protein QG620_23 [Patescibacteria group bacterium]|nr:hypothetical protein [Patescibacteria group bacterium]
MTNNKTIKLILLEKALKVMAVLVLKKYKPRIIGITGSIGKTSAKEAIFTVLAGHFRVRKNEKNYNNEVGLPLTIIGAESGGRSFAGWFFVFLRWLRVLALPFKYPEVLILEMGADRPGDIRYLTSFIKSEMAVITDISSSHLEFFKNIEGVAAEKWVLAESLDGKGLAAVNIDNSQILKKVKSLPKEKANFLTFGFSEEAEIRATDVLYNYSSENETESAGELKGLSFKLNYKGTSIPVRLNNVLARHNIYAALAAISVGIGFGLNLVEIGAALANFSMPCGRMNLIPGIKGSQIIDDTYNSSPVSASAALEVLGNIKTGRKIAVLGDMLELGKNTETGHRSVAKKFLEIRGDIFFAVGKRMRFALSELEKNNFSSDGVFAFSDPEKAGRKLQRIIKEGDVVLVKGSQGMRMEKIVEEIMAEPEKSGNYLCRQSPAWKEKPWKEV